MGKLVREGLKAKGEARKQWYLMQLGLWVLSRQERDKLYPKVDDGSIE